MAAIEYLINHLGSWTGVNRLWLDPEDEADVSAATAALSPVARESFVIFAYTWGFQGQAQEGLLLLSQDSQGRSVQAVWIDSWHMGDKFMICQGSPDDEGLISLKGSYAAPPGPDWGWRIVIDTNTTHALKMLMYNISPEGDEMLAVEAEYTRQS